MHRPTILALALGAALSGCVSPPPGAQPAGGDPDAPAQVLAFGEPFETSEGQVFVLRIQDEYRVIRCIPDGPIAGCYEDVLSVSDSSVVWNEWMQVTDVPGLQVAFVAPGSVALVQRPAHAPVELPAPE